ncbi:MAG: hypothetical protein ACLPWF_23165 [Bryobacteraceae bacterium]
MVRIAVAILAGYASVGVLVVLTDLIFAAAIPGFRTMPTEPVYYFVIVTFTDALYSVAGGYLCAVIARAAVRNATLGLMIFGEIIGVVSVVLGWNIQPHWFALALLMLFPIAVWYGSRLRSPGVATLKAAA